LQNWELFLHLLRFVNINEMNSLGCARLKTIKENEMKTWIYAFTALALLLGLIFVPTTKPAAAAADCGDSYTVKKGDYLTAIAKTCGTTLESILQLNPTIKNPSLIYPGQVLKMKGVVTPTTTPTTTVTPVPSGDTYTVVRGDTLGAIAKKFGTTISALLAVNPNIKNASIIYVGQVIKLPSTATNTSGNAKLTLSATSVTANTQITVTLTGFPKNAEIDFRLGKQGNAYSVVVDGKTDSNGTTTAKVTIPTSAVVGEKWVVVAVTTELSKAVSITSTVITIK
jgi:LysM repeat protein